MHGPRTGPAPLGLTVTSAAEPTVSTRVAAGRRQGRAACLCKLVLG